jgi:hypothetical protein
MDVLQETKRVHIRKAIDLAHELIKLLRGLCLFDGESTIISELCYIISELCLLHHLNSKKKKLDSKTH